MLDDRTTGPYRDRFEAGRELAQYLDHYRGRDDAVLLALPRGGVQVGFTLAGELGLPLDVFIVRKLGLPGQPELAVGAIASGGVRVINQQLAAAAGLRREDLDAVTRLEQEELERREIEYRDGRSAPDITGKTVILVDDGLATGATMVAAVHAVRQLHPARIVVAVPVASPDTCRGLHSIADEVICVMTPEPLISVGSWYEDFTQVTDDEVKDLLGRASMTPANPS